MTDEPVDRLSEVLLSLQELSDENSSRSVQVLMTEQIAILRDVQEQMQEQLKAHDAQILALKELISLLTGKSS